MRNQQKRKKVESCCRNEENKKTSLKFSLSLSSLSFLFLFPLFPLPYGALRWIRALPCSSYSAFDIHIC